MKISATHIANLFDFGTYQGVNESYLRTFLVETNLDVCNSENFVTETEFLSVFKELILNAKNPYFGLNYGAYLNIKALGFISDISLNATSIEQAVLILMEYLNTSFPLINLTVKEDETYYTLLLDSRIEDKTIKNNLLDIIYCFIYRELALMLNEDFSPLLKLPYNDIRPYSLQFNLEVEKGDKHLILLDKKVLKTEINKKKVKEIECLLPKFMMMLETENNEYKNFSRQVRNMTLNMCKPEIPTFEQVSKQFPMSDRTIQRKLTTEGVSFRKIADDIKRELSVYLRIGKRMKTQDIAYVLGYSDASAYLHAVNRWKANY